MITLRPAHEKVQPADPLHYCEQGQYLEESYFGIGNSKVVHATKGYGFFAPDGESKDVFVPISAVKRTGLKDDQKVNFDIEARRDRRESAEPHAG